MEQLVYTLENNPGFILDIAEKETLFTNTSVVECFKILEVFSFKFYTCYSKFSEYLWQIANQKYR